jgi:Glycosyltransferase family 87
MAAMQLPDNTRDSPTPGAVAGQAGAAGPSPRGRWSRTLELAQRAWRYAPRYEEQLSWLGPGLQGALVRTLGCGVLLFAMLAHVRPLPYTDLYPTYVAGHLANEGRWDHIYHRSVWLYHAEDAAWDQRVQELTGACCSGTSFVYHPWYLQLIRPIVTQTRWIEFQQGWVTFSKACVVAAGLGIVVLLGRPTLRLQALVTLVLGIAGTTIDGILLGQNVLPALVFSLGAAIAWRSSAPLWLGALCAALAWTCKPWCASLLLLCFILRGTRAGLITSLALAVVMGVVPALVLPEVLMRDYREMTLAIARVSVDGYNNLSLLSVLERFTSPEWSKHLLEWWPRQAGLALRLTSLGIAGLVFVIGAGLWWRRQPSLRYTITAYLAFMLLPLGICWTHYFVFALPLALLCTFGEDSPLALRAIGVTLLGVLLGLLHQVVVDGPQVQAYLVAPLRYPWRYASPMLLVLSAALGALVLAPRAASELRP